MPKNHKTLSGALFAVGLLMVVICFFMAPHQVSVFELPRDASALAAYQTTTAWLDGFSMMGLVLVMAGSIVFIRGSKKPHADAA